MSEDPRHGHIPVAPSHGANRPKASSGARSALTEPLGPGTVVAIDGPSGSGKSSVSRVVAQELGLAYLDTGAMYRALAWWCRERGIDRQDGAAVAHAAQTLPLELTTDPRAPRVVVDGRDIRAAIRSSEISAVVSQVATNLGVRAELIARQRAVIVEASAGPGIVAEGRDITTVVAPDAEVRVLLVANEQARLRRRARQLHGSTGEELIEATRDEVLRRDRDDSTVAEFASAAEGVVLVDTSDLTFAESVAAVLAVARSRRP